MRSVILLLTGFGLLAAGAGVIALGHLLPGIALIVLGLALKVTGFLLGDSTDSTASAPGRGPQTLAGRSVERPRAGIPVGRAPIRRGAVVSPLRPARSAAPRNVRHQQRQKRAS